LNDVFDRYEIENLSARGISVRSAGHVHASAGSKRERLLCQWNIVAIRRAVVTARPQWNTCVRISNGCEVASDEVPVGIAGHDHVPAMHAAKEHTSPPRVRQRTQGSGCVAEPPLSTLPPSKSHRANESPAAAF